VCIFTVNVDATVLVIFLFNIFLWEL